MPIKHLINRALHREVMDRVEPSLAGADVWLRLAWLWFVRCRFSQDVISATLQRLNTELPPFQKSGASFEIRATTRAQKCNTGSESL